MKSVMPQLTVTRFILIVSFCCLSLSANENRNQFTENDFLIAPLRVHFLSSKNNPDLTTVLTDSDFTRILKKVNKVWAQAGIAFYLESLIKEDVAEDESSTDVVRRSLSWVLKHRPLNT